MERKPQGRNSASQFSDLLRSARIKSLEPRSLCNIVTNHRFSSAGHSYSTVTLLVADVSLHICLITVFMGEKWLLKQSLFISWIFFFFNAYKFFNRYVLFMLENMNGQSSFKAAKINLVAFTLISHAPELAMRQPMHIF